MRPEWAERDPNDAEVALLALLYEAWLEFGRWPTHAYVEARLFQQSERDLERLLAGIPIGLLWPDPAQGSHYHEQATMAPTLFGLSFVPAAHSDIALFLVVLRWSVTARLAYTPPPEGPADLRIPISEIVSDLRQERRLVEASRIAQVLRLFAHEPFVPSLLGGGDSPENGLVDVPRDVRRYKDVDDLEDYLHARPGPTRSRVPVTANPWDMLEIDEEVVPATVSEDDAGSAYTAASGADSPASLVEVAQDVGDPALMDLPPRAVDDLAAAVDTLGFAPLARGIADLVNAKTTRLPLTIAIAGPWGAGKSSIMRQLQDMLSTPNDESGRSLVDARRWHVVHFDAWRYESSDRLWAALTKAIYESALDGSWLARARFRTTLEWQRQGRAKWFAKLVLPFSPLIAAVIYVAHSPTTRGLVTVGAGGFATMIGLAASAAQRWSGFGSIVADPFKRAIDLYTIRPRFEGQLGFTSEAERDVTALTKRLTRKNANLAVFVDDLDRCSPAHVVEVVEAINQIFNASRESRTLFVLGMDVDVVSASLAAAYEPTVAQLDPRRRRTFGREYLRKVAQLFVAVPRPENEGLLQLLMSISGAVEARETYDEAAVLAIERQIEAVADDGTSLSEAAEAVRRRVSTSKDEVAFAEAVRRERAKAFGSDSEDVLQAERVLVPHVARNPRALKQFDNAFRLQLHVANNSPTSRLSFSFDQLIALGKWVILRLRWPDLAALLDSDPAVLTRLEEAAQMGDWAPFAESMGEDYDSELMALLTDSGGERRISGLPLQTFLRIV